MNQREIAHHTLPGTDILIDGFRFAHPRVSAYILSHFHSDHYSGLTETFPFFLGSEARVFCSHVTGDLVVHALGVKERYVVRLPFNERRPVADGVDVVLLPANHCPGAAMLLLFMPNGRIVLHTGDMRYSPDMQHYPHLRAVAGGLRSGPRAGEADAVAGAQTGGPEGPRVDEVLLDTTYSHPKHVFMRQEESIGLAVDIVRGYLPPGGPPPAGFADTAGVLVCVATYVVGKERVLAALAERLRLRVYAAQRKYAILQLLGLPSGVIDFFTPRKTAASVHVCGWGVCGRASPYFQPDFSTLHRYLVAANRLHAMEALGLLATAQPAAPTRNPDGAPPAVTNAEADDEEDAFVASAGNAESDATPSTAVPAAAPQLNPWSLSAMDEARLREVPPRYTRIVGIVPTGWVHSAKRKHFSSPAGATDPRRGGTLRFPVDIHLVPYSEHSSFDELVEFVKFLRPRKVTPTVFEDENHQRKICERFAHLTNHTAAKKAFFAAFGKGTATDGGAPPDALAGSKRASSGDVSEAEEPSPAIADEPPTPVAVTTPAALAPDADTIVDLTDDGDGARIALAVADDSTPAQVRQGTASRRQDGSADSSRKAARTNTMLSYFTPRPS